MKTSREFSSFLSEMSVRKVIYNQIRSVFPYGYINGNCFRLYRTYSKNPHGYFLFRIDGKIITGSDPITVRYSIKPTILVVFLSFMLFSVLLFGVANQLKGHKNEIFIIGGFVFNVVFNLSVYSQKKKHIQRFESLFHKID